MIGMFAGPAYIRSHSCQVRITGNFLLIRIFKKCDGCACTNNLLSFDLLLRVECLMGKLGSVFPEI